MKTKLAFMMISCMYAFIQHANSQDPKDEKSDTQVRMEVIKEQCKDIPLDKRIRVTVARFSSTAGNAPVELGNNMSTMLSSSLSQVNCFNVLEEQKNLSDMTNEIDASNSEYTDAAYGIEKTKMKLAQIIITGEVTEYNDATTGVKVIGIGGRKTTANIGFILKIINPRTREILKSTSFNVKSKKGGSFDVLFLSSEANSNPAIADALEKGIVQATEYLASEKDNIPLPSEDELNSNLTMLTLNDVTFSQKSSVLELIKNTNGVKKVELSSYANSIAVYSVRHNGSTDELATIIDGKYSDQFEITGAQSGKIIMNFK